MLRSIRSSSLMSRCPSTRSTPCTGISTLRQFGSPAVASRRLLNSETINQRSNPLSRVLASAELQPYNQLRPDPRLQVLRALSSAKDGEKTKKADGQSEDNELVLTPGEKVVVAGRLGLWAGIAAFAAVCAYYIGKELFPTKMSPNRVFDRSLEVVRNHSDVKHRFGEPLKGYGREHGGHREGRRNFIEHTEYKGEDGDNRTRVRYNLEGKFGKAFVFAEVSSNMSSGEFVYILVQDKSNGRVFTVVDNRAALTAQRLVGNKEAQSAMSQLLTGGDKK